MTIELMYYVTAQLDHALVEQYRLHLCVFLFDEQGNGVVHNLHSGNVIPSSHYRLSERR